MITDQERAEEYRSCLGYVLDNLEQRGNPKASCASDEQLVKYIKWTLSDEGLETGVQISRDAKQCLDPRTSTAE